MITEKGTETVGETQTFAISDTCPVIKEDQDKGKEPSFKGIVCNDYSNFFTQINVFVHK